MQSAVCVGLSHQSSNLTIAGNLRRLRRHIWFPRSNYWGALVTYIARNIVVAEV